MLRGNIDQFESVLPREVKRELVTRRPKKDPDSASMRLVIGVSAAIVAVCLLTRPGVKTEPAVNVAIPTPTPTAVANVPRAELVRMPAPRADLVLGQIWNINMPNGVNVRATIKGLLDSTTLLPSTGNSPGDAYLVGPNTWVWLYDHGQAQWIDP